MMVLGPVFWYDLIRNGRRTRYLVLRCLYVALLLFAFWLIYQEYGMQLHAQGVGGRNGFSQADMAVFGERFFGYFLVIQYAILILVTPAYVASAIAEEKQRKTLEFMLTTDLTRREIVFGKLASRLGLLTLLVLAGLPVISCAQLLGGISPMLLWCGFAATAVTLFSLTNVTLLVSTYARRVRDALFNSYLVIVGYLIFWGFLRLFFWLLKLDNVPPTPLAIMDDILEVYELPNPFMAIYDLREFVQRTGGMGNRPVELLIAYAIWHVVVGGCCLSLALWRVRAVYVRQALGEKASKPTGPMPSPLPLKPVAIPAATKPLKARPRRHPPVREDAMLWKEVFVERGMRVGALGQVLLIYLALAVLGPGLVLAGAILLQLVVTGQLEGFGGLMNKYVRVAGTLIYGILLLGIGVRAAGAISMERDRQTYESLMATPLSLWNILRAKWIGSLLSFRRVGFVLLLIWFLGVITTGIHVLGYLELHLLLLVHAIFAASFGMACATLMRSGLRAMASTVFVLLWFAGTPLLVDAIWGIERSGWGAFVMGLSPPYVAYQAGFDIDELRQRQDEVMQRAAHLWPGQRDFYGRVRRYDDNFMPSFYNWHPTTFACFCSGYFFALLGLAACLAAFAGFSVSSGRTRQKAAPPLPVT